MKTLTGYLYYPNSLEEAGGSTFCLVRSEEDNVKYLGVIGSADGFRSTHAHRDQNHALPAHPGQCRCAAPASPLAQTSAARADKPAPVLATAWAWRPPVMCAPSRALHIAPIFAQQSVRENARTRRTPQQVIDDATWGVFQTGWRKPWGADADHLKTTADLDSFFDAGFTFFTIDPGEHVDNAAQTDPIDRLREKVRDLPWDRLQSTAAGNEPALPGPGISGRRFSGDLQRSGAAARPGEIWAGHRPHPGDGKSSHRAARAASCMIWKYP